MKKYYITEQANGKFSIFTSTGVESMADESLIKWDIETDDEAEIYVTEILNGIFSYDLS